jgi:Phytanoyl-CoA dioxygenase (PhyH)
MLASKVITFVVAVCCVVSRTASVGTSTTSKSAGFFGQVTGGIAALNDRVLMENAERLGAMEKELIGQKLGKVEKIVKIPLKAVASKPIGVKNLLLRDGVVCISNVLSSATADAMFPLVRDVEETAVTDIEAGTADVNDRFGKVNNRRKRADLFLPYDNLVVQAAVKEAVSNLKPLLLALDDMEESGVLHELSSIVSDGGSPRQCLHCDTPYLEGVKPLYTFFMALQDVEDDMGHTTFLPGTMTSEVHGIFNSGEKQKNNLIAMSPAFRSNLKKGDVAIFDSRLLHCGGANESEDKRRILFYFT